MYLRPRESVPTDTFRLLRGLVSETADTGGANACAMVRAEMGDIIDINEHRRKRQPPEDPPYENYVQDQGDRVGIGLAFEDEFVEFSFTYEGATHFARLIQSALRKIDRKRARKCEHCGEPFCHEWHVGVIYQGWRRERQVKVVVERVTEKGSVRLRDLDTGETFYSRAAYCWAQAPSKLTPLP